MSEAIVLTSSLIVGLLLGMLFFSGLWWTIRLATGSRQPAIWFMGSMMLRTCIALAGFYWVALGHWQRLIACVVGFFVGRLIVTWFTRSSPEASHAS